MNALPTISSDQCIYFGILRDFSRPADRIKTRNTTLAERFIINWKPRNLGSIQQEYFQNCNAGVSAYALCNKSLDNVSVPRFARFRYQCLSLVCNWWRWFHSWLVTSTFVSTASAFFYCNDKPNLSFIVAHINHIFEWHPEPTWPKQNVGYTGGYLSLPNTNPRNWVSDTAPGKPDLTAAILRTGQYY